MAGKNIQILGRSSAVGYRNFGVLHPTFLYYEWTLLSTLLLPTEASLHNLVILSIHFFWKSYSFHSSCTAQVRKLGAWSCIQYFWGRPRAAVEQAMMQSRSSCIIGMGSASLHGCFLIAHHQMAINYHSEIKWDSVYYKKGPLVAQLCTTKLY